MRHLGTAARRPDFLRRAPSFQLLCPIRPPISNIVRLRIRLCALVWRFENNDHQLETEEKVGQSFLLNLKENYLLQK